MADAAGSLGLMTYDFNVNPNQQKKGKQALTALEPNQVELASLHKKSNDVGDTIGRRLQNRYEEWLLSRRYIEEDWLRYVRAYNGVYEPEIEQNFRPGQSRVFVQLTRMKTDTSFNRLSDLLFGAEDHWDITPSPLPELSEERVEELRSLIMEQMAQDPNMQAQAEPEDEELEKVEEDVAKRAAKRMRQKIKDQLEAQHYQKKARECIFEMCQVGTGVMKGPMIGVDIIQKYQRTKNGCPASDKEHRRPIRTRAPSCTEQTCTCPWSACLGSLLPGS